jgi:hypothetical protein
VPFVTGPVVAGCWGGCWFGAVVGRGRAATDVTGCTAAGCWAGVAAASFAFFASSAAITTALPTSIVGVLLAIFSISTHLSFLFWSKLNLALRCI